MIKLIVNYTYTLDGSVKRDRSFICTFDSISDVSNDSILLQLSDYHGNYNFTIKDIKQLINN